MRMEALTLSNCDKNVCTFLKKQQENFLDINHLRSDGITYNPQRFATLVFDELIKTNCPNFLDNAKSERSKCIKRTSRDQPPEG